MDKNSYLTILACCFVLLFFNQCGSAKKVRINDSGSLAPISQNPKTALSKSVHKTSKITKNLTVAEKVDRYIKTYAQAAQFEMEAYRIPASITLAQGILESGMGESRLATEANNHFGIKCHQQWQGQRIYHDDDEKGECFRVYQDPRTSYRDHSLFLTSRPRYDFLFDLQKNDYKGWANGLKKAGYATDPKYPDKLISLIERYRLDRFDHPNKKSKAKNQGISTVQNIVHRVQKGDTLYSISKMYQIDLHLLVQENKIENNTIFLGQNLIIPQTQ